MLPSHSSGVRSWSRGPKHSSRGIWLAKLPSRGRSFIHLKPCKIWHDESFILRGSAHSPQILTFSLKPFIFTTLKWGFRFRFESGSAPTVCICIYLFCSIQITYQYSDHIRINYGPSTRLQVNTDRLGWGACPVEMSWTFLRGLYQEFYGDIVTNTLSVCGLLSVIPPLVCTMSWSTRQIHGYQTIIQD